MQKNKKKIHMHAFTLVETLITLLAITIMIAGPLTFMYKSYKYAELVKVRLIASGLSQEGLELATSLRNFDLNQFKTLADACSLGCMVDWDGVSSKPSMTPCSNESCRLYKSTSDSNKLYSSSGDTATDFYRYVKFTPNGTQGYTAESVTWANVESIKVEVNLKKYFLNIIVK